MVFSENISQYFSVDDFAISATFTPEGGSSTAVKGIFENLFSEDLSVNGTLPTFTCSESDVSTLAVDGTITINSNNYFVRQKKADGTGVTTLVLEKSLS